MNSIGSRIPTERCPKLLTLEETCAKLGLTRQALERLIDEGQIWPAATLRAIRKDAGTYRSLFRARDVVCLAAGLKRDAKPTT